LPPTLCRNTTVKIEGGTSANSIKFPACSPDTLEEKITIVKKTEPPSVTKKNIIIIMISNICNHNDLSAIVTDINNSKTNINNGMDTPLLNLLDESVKWYPELKPSYGILPSRILFCKNGIRM
jgi:hypothetical protein